MGVRVGGFTLLKMTEACGTIRVLYMRILATHILGKWIPTHRLPIRGGKFRRGESSRSRFTSR
jgi:hypothetical protein